MSLYVQKCVFWIKIFLEPKKKTTYYNIWIVWYFYIVPLTAQFAPLFSLAVLGYEYNSDFVDTDYKFVSYYRNKYNFILYFLNAIFDLNFLEFFLHYNHSF